MFSHLLSWLYYNWGAYIYLFPIPISVLALFVLIKNRRRINSFFRNLDKRYLILLFLVLVIFIFISWKIGLNFRFFNPSDEDQWGEVFIAKQLVSGEKNAILANHLPGPVIGRSTLPILLAFGFRAFGLNPLVASVLNLVLATLSVFLVFILTQVIFNNEKISLISSLIYAFSPFTWIFSFFRMGEPTIASFFLLLSTIFLVLAFKHHRFDFHILSILFLELTAQTRAEHFTLIVLYIIFFFSLKEYKKFSYKKLLILILLILILSLPIFITDAKLKTCSQWCGYGPQLRSYLYNIPFSRQIDRVLIPLTTNRISINYFFSDIPYAVKFYFSKKMLFLSLLVLSGFVLALREHKKESILLLSSFLLLLTGYLLDCNIPETRYLFPSYSLIFPFSGLAIVYPLSKLDRIHIGRKITNVLIIILTLIIIFYPFSPILSHFHFINGSFYTNYHLDDFYRDYVQTWLIDSLGDIKAAMKESKIPLSNSVVIANNVGDEVILEIMGYKVRAIQSNEVYLKDRNKFFKSFTSSLDNVNDYYFLWGPYCYGLSDQRDICNFIKKNYTMKLMGQANDYLLYSLRPIKGQQIKY